MKVKPKQATAGRWRNLDSHPRLSGTQVQAQSPIPRRHLHTDQECLGQPELSTGCAPDSAGCGDTEEGGIWEGFLEGAAFDLGLYSDPAPLPRPLPFPSPGREAPDAPTSGQGPLGNDFHLPSPRWALRAEGKR